MLLSPSDAASEVDRAVDLLTTSLGEDVRACVLVSGGLDSDVVARLAARAVGSDRLTLVTILQDEMSTAHLDHAEQLAKSLGTELHHVDLRGIHLDVLYRMSVADKIRGFDPLGLLDPARMKCSIRTVIVSAYQDRGHVILGTSNRTENMLGFYLPFGDGLWHVGPIAHLYKTEVRLVAEVLGTAPEVLEQPPSAGFWEGQTDREDLGYWLVNAGPIHKERSFSDEEDKQARSLSARLDEADVDLVLCALAEEFDPHTTPAGTRLGTEIVDGLGAIVATSARTKNRPLGTSLDRRHTGEPVT